MKNNKKTILLILITITTLILLSTASATTDNTNKTTTSSIKEKTTTTEPVVKEKIENTQTKELKTDKTQDKTITKTNKTRENTKTTTQTFEINDWSEFTSTINTINQDTENDDYIINFNEGTYTLTSSPTISSEKNITINGNDQTITATGMQAILGRITSSSPLFINNLNVGVVINLNGLTTLNNSKFSNKPLNLNNDSILYNVTSGNNYNNNGTSKVYNSIITGTITNYEEKTIIFHNTTIDATINNYGTIIIDDTCILGENYKISEYSTGIIITNETNPYDGNNEINNENITKDITIPITGNITFTNCQINAKITNNGNLTIINTVISDKITNNGQLLLQNCSLSNNNMTTTGSKTDGFLLENKGNVTLINCHVENNTFTSNFTTSTSELYHLYGAIFNKGLMDIINSSLSNNKVGESNSSRISAYGAVITNNGTLSLNNCICDSNNASTSGSVIYDIGNYIYWDNNLFDYAYSNTNAITIDNSEFNNNFAGYHGGAIYAKNTRYTITNTNFTHNDVDNQYYGGISIAGGVTSTGGALHIGGIGIIENCEFKDNYIGILDGKIPYNSFRGGAIYIEGFGSSNITNTKFVNNTAETGATIFIGAGGGLFFNNNVIDNCVFENNYLEDSETGNILQNMGYLNISNSEFKNNYDANNLIGLYGEDYTTNVLNTKFTDNKMTNSTISSTQKTGTIKNNTYTNTTINDILTLNTPNKIYTGEPITITGTYNINNLKCYDQDILEQNKFNIYINGVLNQTVDTLEFIITPTTGTMMVTVQPTISQTRKTESIRATTLTDIIITPENYNEYIYESALVGVNKDTKILFQGEFTDKSEIAIDTPDIILDGSNATFTNTIFKLEATGLTLQNMKINNTQTQYPIQNTKDNNIITGNTITITNTGGKTAAIYNKANNTEISHNTIYVDGPAGDIDYEGEGVCTTQAILLIGGNQNTIENNDITITSTSSASSFGTIEGITNSKQATNTIIKGNKLNVSGGMFNYAINSLTNIANITITENNILVTGERYTDGIQIGDNAENITITKNNITCYCLNTTPIDQAGITYGIITTRQGGQQSNNINIAENNIQLTGRANYGMEIYETTKTQVINNNITLTGIKSMGIGLAHSPNSTITGNTIITNDNSTTPLTGIVEEIRPQNVGIQLQQDSGNILIEDNTIQTYDVAAQDNCINVETNNVTIKNNNLTSSTQTGDNTITTTQPDTTTIKDNTAIEQESTTQTTTETLTTGDNTTLTAQFYDDTYTPAGDGKAIFKVNGKTLRDDQGNVIYADVINGRAELPNINITQEWTKEGTTIQAVYVGNDNNEPITTKPTTVTVTKPEATITIDAPTEATAGTTITLKATVTDGENNINTGRVAFKLNGKTLKNAEGKALYAEVKDGIATITYTIPEKTKAKEYTLIAVFTDTAYDRVEAESKLNVVKA